MPDAALRATERQFCALLYAASTGLVVEVTFYALPSISRGEAPRLHIAEFYEPLSNIESDPPDGLIVTGTEPKCRWLEDEVFWPCLSRLVDTVDDLRIPAIWSCLAAHAAVYRRDSIERIALGQKLSGVFECRVDVNKHPVLHRLPRTWRVPHSRRNGLDRRQLTRYGYDILSSSPLVAVDMFCKQGETLQLYLQGHPEYDPGTLVAEYRRDLLRLKQENPNLSLPPPIGLAPKSDNPGFAGYLIRSVQGCIRFSSQPADCGPPMLHAEDYWSTHARQLFTNWLTYLDTTRAAPQRRGYSDRSVAPNDAEMCLF